MRKAVVTGAAGFAGCNLVEHLLARGYYVYAIVRPNSPHNIRLRSMSSTNLCVIDRDRTEFGELYKNIDEDCDFFFHLAWQGGRNDFYIQQENIIDTLMALESSYRLGCRRFICTGSQAEYGRQSKLTTEDTLPSPETAYGAAKLAACIVSKNRAKQLGIEWIWARIFSLYGKYEPPTTMISYLTSSLKNGQIPELTKATQNWDYLDAGEAADALILLAENGHDGEIYNIANGNYRPLKEFVDAMKNKIDPTAKIKYNDTSGDLVSLQPSVKKIYKHIGWQAKHSLVE